jgi:hypothetical protein
MHGEDQRHARTAGALQRVVEDSLDLQPVAGGVADHFLAGQLDIGKPRVRVGQALRFTLSTRKAKDLPG